MLSDSIKLVIHVVKDQVSDDDRYAVHDLRHHLRLFAKIYTKIWPQLGPVEPGSTFFRIEFMEDSETDGDVPVSESGQEVEPQEALVVGTLSTLGVEANGHGAGGRGFELMIEKMDYEDDDSDWEEDEAQGKVLIERRIV
jgi:hypothetical protein